MCEICFLILFQNVLFYYLSLGTRCHFSSFVGIKVGQREWKRENRRAATDESRQNEKRKTSGNHIDRVPSVFHDLRRRRRANWIGLCLMLNCRHQKKYSHARDHFGSPSYPWLSPHRHQGWDQAERHLNRHGTWEAQGWLGCWTRGYRRRDSFVRSSFLGICVFEL